MLDVFVEIHSFSLYIKLIIHYNRKLIICCMQSNIYNVYTTLALISNNYRYLKKGGEIYDNIIIVKLNHDNITQFEIRKKTTTI
jgi:hypothetical protein